LNFTTPLLQEHLKSSAKLINFHGWEMPINYGSQIAEHNTVRNSCGIFDVSHMTILDLSGKENLEFIKYLLANDVASLKEECDALYSPMLNHEGGIKDDLIIYSMKFGFRMIVNCATREKDLAWISKIASSFEVIVKERQDLAMVALQGPKSDNVLKQCIDEISFSKLQKKKTFQGIITKETMITRTGYTGEKGVEILLPKEKATDLWNNVIKAGARPIGLGARDTLRLEAGMNLYGFEMDEMISPLECNMSLYVSLEDKNREFIGKNSYIMKKDSNDYSVLKGMLIDDKAIIRNGQKVFIENGGMNISGVVTSGSFSPSLLKGIALVRIPEAKSTKCFAEVRGKKIRGILGKPKFMKEGKSIF